jgi:hypothetical protein
MAYLQPHRVDGVKGGDLEKWQHFFGEGCPSRRQPGVVQSLSHSGKLNFFFVVLCGENSFYRPRPGGISFGEVDLKIGLFFDRRYEDKKINRRPDIGRRLIL